MEDNALTITSFVVRFIHSGPPENAPLRGSVLNVQTNEEHHFLHWQEALEFIGRFVKLNNDELRMTTPVVRRDDE
ncbi:MAG TPA: hypothetical protein PK205_08735 [Promineifilum sp.]|nr:hypothetical protein [Promineifilum sp.]HRQ13379.1 hypothetical protein [Promineifilum sp.]